MHLLILVLLVIAAALLATRLLPDEPGLVRFTRWLLYAVAATAGMLAAVTLVIAALGL